MEPIPYRFRGEIVGDEQVKKILESAPMIVKTHMRKWMRYAGSTFIGSNKKYSSTSKRGAVRNAIYKNNRLRDGKKWESKFVNLFSYRINEETMTMRAGLLYTDKKKVHEIAELLEKGGQITSNGYMILPNYKGNPSQFGENHKTSRKIFHNLVKAEELRMVFKGGNILYFDKVTKKLVFVGVKAIKVKSQFDFEGAINSVRSEVEKKASTVLDQAMEDAAQNQKYTNHEMSD